MSLTVVRGWKALPEALKGVAVAVGNFDGVHRGHARVVAAATEAARRDRLPLAAAVFDPHPRRWFQPEAPPFRLMSDGQRARALKGLGVERLYVLPFESELVEMSDLAFAQGVLTEGLGARWVAAGFDFTFGRGRSGDGALLRAYGERFGFGVTIVEEVADGSGQKLSSTAVRRALTEGRPEVAAEILGRPFAIEGEVVHGAKRGRDLGFPTANVALGDYLRPRFGIYATRTRLPDGRLVDGVSNLGVAPMFPEAGPRLEVWLFDFDEPLYGRCIETELVAFLRDEATYDTVEALKAQVARDAEEARARLSAS